MQIAVAGVRDDRQVHTVPHRHLLQRRNVMHQLRARHGHILTHPILGVHVQAPVVAAQLHQPFRLLRVFPADSAANLFKFDGGHRLFRLGRQSVELDQQQRRPPRREIAAIAAVQFLKRGAIQ